MRAGEWCPDHGNSYDDCSFKHVQPVPRSRLRLIMADDPLVCAGCAAAAPVGTEGWKRTDADWCPKCAWLA